MTIGPEITWLLLSVFSKLLLPCHLKALLAERTDEESIQYSVKQKNKLKASCVDCHGTLHLQHSDNPSKCFKCLFVCFLG